jgi:hypothetical protein
MSTTDRTMICPKCGEENLSWRGRCRSCGTPLHEDEDVSVVPPRERGGLFWSAFLAGLVGTGIFGFIAFAFLWGPGAYSFFLGLLAIPLIGLGVCWKRPQAGGRVLMLASLLPPVGVMATGVMIKPFPTIWNSINSSFHYCATPDIRYSRH